MKNLLLALICVGSLVNTFASEAFNNIGASPYTTGQSNGNVIVCRWDGGSPDDIKKWGGFGNNLPKVPFNYIYGKNTIFAVTNDGNCNTDEIKDWPQMHIKERGQKMYLYKITVPAGTELEYIGQTLFNEYKTNTPAYQTYTKTLAKQIWDLDQINEGKPATEAALLEKLQKGYFKPGGGGLDSQFEVQIKGPITNTNDYKLIGDCIVGTANEYCNKVF